MIKKNFYQKLLIKTKLNKYKCIFYPHSNNFFKNIFKPNKSLILNRLK